MKELSEYAILNRTKDYVIAQRLLIQRLQSQLYRMYRIINGWIGEH